MNNSPNMSYVAFENTSRAMEQCEGTVGNAIDDGEPLVLDQYERHYFAGMKLRCQQLIERLEQYKEHFGDTNKDAG